MKTLLAALALLVVGCDASWYRVPACSMVQGDEEWINTAPRCQKAPDDAGFMVGAWMAEQPPSLAINGIKLENNYIIGFHSGAHDTGSSVTYYPSEGQIVPLDGCAQDRLGSLGRDHQQP